MEAQLIGNSNKFNEKITTLSLQFFSALDDYIKYYVYYHKNPEVNEFQNYYINSKSQVQSLSKDIYLITNNIYNNIESLDNEMSLIAIKLEEEKKKNTKLTNTLKNLENTQNGSVLLIDDSKNEYNQQYYYNWELFFGILIVCGLIGKIFKSSSSVE